MRGELRGFNDTHAVCTRPRLPDSARSLVGRLDVLFSPNGQCTRTIAQFELTNSQVEKLSGAAGAPTDMQLNVDISGAGLAFPQLPSAVCRYRPLGPFEGLLPTVDRSVKVTSTTSATCLGNPTGSIGMYAIDFLQDGASAVLPLYEQLLFFSYDLSAVRLSAMSPSGGPLEEATSVTVLGHGFAMYGVDQIRCMIDGAMISAIFVDSHAVLCTLPPFATVQSYALRLSLNNGVDGTIVQDTLTFSTYAPPAIISVRPTEGPASGGTVVTVQGWGFAALGGSELRCCFEHVCSVRSPLYYNDSTVVCNSTWGLQATFGSLVTLALNGLQDPVLGKAPRFFYYGTRPPALVDVHFSDDATTIVIQFDSQPTNRAGMNGLAPCSRILSDATSHQIRGSSPMDAQCTWKDDSTLIAQLSILTDARPGSTITTRPNVLWPKSWDYPGSCGMSADNESATDSSLCAGELSLTIDAAFPCDRRLTIHTRELCAQPIAILQAPAEISSCPGTALLLDGSRSSGGGIKPLVYLWGVNPRSTDNYPLVLPAIKAQAAQSTSTPRIKLSSLQLHGGSVFEFALVVVNFLGAASQPTVVSLKRAALPIPSITIQSPPLLLFSSSVTVLLEARATLPDCFANTSVRFRWSQHFTEGTAVRVNQGANPNVSLPWIFPPGATALFKRDLQVSGAKLQPGALYKLQVTGALESNPAIFGAAVTTIGLRDEPLRSSIAGGDRIVGEDAFELNACSSSDPDDLQAPLSFRWVCKRALANASGTISCPMATGEPLPPPMNNSCIWSIGAGVLPRAHYRFSVTVVKPGGEAATSEVVITQEEWLLPSISIDPLPASKSNPSERLVLRGRLNRSRTSSTAETSTPATKFHWSLSPSEVALDDAAVSTTGRSHLNLVLRPGTLQPGATYTFTLIAYAHGMRNSANAGSDSRFARATATVVMNRAPFGGELRLSFSSPIVALQSEVEIEAYQWTDDDPSDLPITYSFAYAPSNLPVPEALDSATGLSKRSMSTSILWQPPAGNWTVFCYIYDAFLASTSESANLLVHGAPDLDAETAFGIVAGIKVAQREGDSSASLRSIASLANLLNEPATNDGEGRQVAHHHLLLLPFCCLCLSADPLLTLRRINSLP